MIGSTKYELANDLPYHNHYNKQDVVVLLNSLDDMRIKEFMPFKEDVL
jgi:hypothetical protein